MRFATLMAGCAALIAAPASAQLLGGAGGAAGQLGGSLGGVNQTVRGSTMGNADLGVDRTVDRRSGRVSTRTTGRGEASGALDSQTVTPRRARSGSAAFGAGGTASVGADADLVGTDDVRAAGRRVRDTADRTRRYARRTADSTLDRVGRTSVSADGSVSVDGRAQTSSRRGAQSGKVDSRRSDRRNPNGRPGGHTREH